MRTKIKVGNFTLCRVKQSDLPTLFHELNKWSIIKYLSAVMFPLTKQRCYSYIVNNYIRKQTPHQFYYTIKLANSNTPIGCITIQPKKRKSVPFKLSPKIKAKPLLTRGFWLSTKFQGKHIMSKCVHAIEQEVFRNYPEAKLLVASYTHNIPSLKIKENNPHAKEVVTVEETCINNKTSMVRFFLISNPSNN